MTALQIARELGIDLAHAQRLLRLHGDWLHAARERRGHKVTYDAEVIELLRGLLGQPHRQISESTKDWLTTYLGERA